MKSVTIKFLENQEIDIHVENNSGGLNTTTTTTTPKNQALPQIPRDKPAIDRTLADRIAAFERGALDSIGTSAEKFISIINVEAPVLFDIGSNNGLFSAICKKHFPKSKMFLFEPVEEYHLFSKIRLIDQEGIEFYNVALSDEDGKLELFLDVNNLGWNTIIKERTDNQKNARSINCIRVSEFIRQRELVGNIDGIKIDVEGAEYLILKDLLQIIRESEKKPVIVVEIGWGTEHPYWESSLKGTLEEYFNLGYQRQDINFPQTFDLCLIPMSSVIG